MTAREGASPERRLALELLGEDGRTVELPPRGTLVLGSGERAGFLIRGQGVDAAHCAIGRLKDGGYAVKDLGSEHGTIRNGKRVGSDRLEPGDVLVLGSRRVRLFDPARPPEPEPTPAPVSLTAPQPTPQPTSEPAPGPAAAPAPGGPGAQERRLGGYRLEKKLGKGAMGEVWLALQENLNRPVALKVLSPARAADADFVRRFQLEARAAAALHHPNVVVIHDVGEADGHHYLSMELMAGGSLEERLAKDGPLPWRAALDALRDAARGLDFAEARGIVHRDIKPANLMLDAAGTVKIADLGLATTADSEEALEGGRRIFGTPHFVSPEQARGEPVDNRSDLYSLGATAYRLLSGRTPFGGETTRDILRAHFTQEPAPIEGIPPELDALVSRLLAKDPAARPQRAQEVVQELERLRLAADAETLAGPARRPARRLAALGALVVAVVGAGLAYLALSGDAGGNGPGNGDGTAAGGAASRAEAGSAPDDAFLTAADPAPPAPPATTGQPDPEAAERLRELEAELALSRVPGEGSERLEGLRAVAADHEGTAAGARAAEEADTLAEEIARAAREAERREARRRAAHDLLARRADWPPAPDADPDPARSLAALWSEPATAPGGADDDPRTEAGGGASGDGPDATTDLAGSPELEAERARLADEIVASSTELLQSALRRAEALAADGDFAEVRARLDALVAATELPEPPEGRTPAGFEGLRELAERVRARREGLEREAEAWRSQLVEGDRETLRATLGAGSPLLVRLESLDLDALAADLEGLLGSLQTSRARTLVGELAEEVARAREALDALGGELALGRWRRRAIADPRTRRPVTVEIESLGPAGVVVGGDAGTETIPWASFTARSETIHQLFHSRLERDYTPDERRGIAALLRLVGVREAAAIAARTLDPGRRTVFRPEDAEEMEAAFEPALAWASEPDLGTEERDRVKAEQAAARLLGRALLLEQERSWSESLAVLETLLADHGGSLLVFGLSDGRPLEVAAGNAPPAPPPEDAQPDR